MDSEEDDKAMSSASGAIPNIADFQEMNSDEKHGVNRSKAAAARSTRFIPLPVNAVALLQEWFDNHESNPFPSNEEKKALATQTGLTVKQVMINITVILIVKFLYIFFFSF